MCDPMHSQWDMHKRPPETLEVGSRREWPDCAVALGPVDFYSGTATALCHNTVTGLSTHSGKHTGSLLIAASMQCASMCVSKAPQSTKPEMGGQSGADCHGVVQQRGTCFNDGEPSFSRQTTGLPSRWTQEEPGTHCCRSMSQRVGPMYCCHFSGHGGNMPFLCTTALTPNSTTPDPDPEP